MIHSLGKNLPIPSRPWQMGPMNFETTMKIHFDEADPAGIAFSGLLFTKAHRCFEEFVAALEQDPEKFFLNSEIIYPIRHIEVDFWGPLLPLHTYEVKIGVTHLGESSFQLTYDVNSGEKGLATLKSTHVCVEKANFQKRTIPTDLKESLKTFARPATHS